MYGPFCVYLGKINKGYIMNTILADIQKDMDDFFAEIDRAIGRVPEKKVKKVQKKAWLSHIFFVS